MSYGGQIKFAIESYCQEVIQNSHQKNECPMLHGLSMVLKILEVTKKVEFCLEENVAWKLFFDLLSMDSVFTPDSLELTAPCISSTQLTLSVEIRLTAGT